MSAPLKPPPTNGRQPKPPVAEAGVADEPSATTRGLAVWRFEYALLAAVVALTSAFAFSFFFFDIDLAQLNTYGYIGLFLISMISAASIVLPMPGAAAITGAGAVLDPVLGIPVPVLVGFVAGLAEALGEFTGYAAGYGGSALFRDRPIYPRVKSWMERRGMITMFVLSCIPNPLVDVAGVAAGAVKMRVWRFFVGVFSGKVVKNMYLASGGLIGAELIQRLFD